MKKRLLSIVLGVAMTTGLLAGCGSSSDGAATSTASSAAEAATSTVEETSTPAEADSVGEANPGDIDTGDGEGKVFNIQAWNEEFKSRIEDHLPGYQKVSATEGKIGDVTVKWTITPSDDNAYQNNLDTVLPENENASADNKVDLFLMEADYALKYVNADVTMSVKDLGITDDQIADQYQYTKDIVTDSDGNLKGLSWQACSAGLIYNRDIAKEVLGSDDPETVQAAVKDWDSYNATAKKLKDAGYFITSSVNDSYRVYSNNVSGPWVQDNKVVIDPNVKKWVDDSKALVDAGETNTYELWSDDWNKGFFPEGKVFCYFGPAWLINFSMQADQEGSVANQGKWGLCEGPQGFYWGGSWIAAATGTDNPTLAKNIMLTMTTDKDVLKDIAVKDSDCVNSKTVLSDLANDSSFKNEILGGQNPYKQLAAGAEKVDMSNISDYDQGCNEEFQNAMKNYFDGNGSYEDALAQFKTAITEKYPDITMD